MKENTSKSQKGSNAVANQVVQKKSSGKSLPSAQPVQLMADEEKEPMQGKFKQGAAGDTVQMMEEEDEKMQG